MKSAIEEYSDVVAESLCYKWSKPNIYSMWEIYCWLGGACMFSDGELYEELDMLRDVAFYRSQTYFEDRYTQNQQILMEPIRGAYR